MVPRTGDGEMLYRKKQKSCDKKKKSENSKLLYQLKRFGSLKSAQKSAQKSIYSKKHSKKRIYSKKALKKALKKLNLLKKGLKKEQPVKKVNSRKCIHSKK